MRPFLLAVLLLLVSTALAPTAAADPMPGDDGDGPMSGKCIAMRGLTGVSVTVAHCIPRLDPDT